MWITNQWYCDDCDVHHECYSCDRMIPFIEKYIKGYNKRLLENIMTPEEMALEKKYMKQSRAKERRSY